VTGLGDRRDDLRRVQDLGHLTPDALKDSAEARPALHDNLHGRSECHLHLGVETGDDAFPVVEFCAVLQCRPFFGGGYVDPRAVDKRYVPLQLSRASSNRSEGSVLVIVGEIHEGHEVVVGGLPADVFVARLDPINDRGVNSGQTQVDPLLESLFCQVGGKTDPAASAFVHRGRRRQAIAYEPPRDVVQHAPVIVDRVTEAQQRSRAGRATPARPPPCIRTESRSGSRLALRVDRSGESDRSGA